MGLPPTARVVPGVSVAEREKEGGWHFRVENLVPNQIPEPIEIC
jgi:hypothetical protein